MPGAARNRILERGSKSGNPSPRKSNTRGRLRGSSGSCWPRKRRTPTGRRELIAEMCPEDAGPEPADVLVEIAPDRHEIANLDACRAAARVQAAGRHAADGIAVACDIKPREHRGEVEGCEVIGRQRGDHGHAGSTDLSDSTVSMPSPARRRSAAEDGGRRLFCFAMQSRLFAGGRRATADVSPALAFLWGRPATGELAVSGALLFLLVAIAVAATIYGIIRWLQRGRRAWWYLV
jgi:hypothetical protein